MALSFGSVISFLYLYNEPIKLYNMKITSNIELRDEKKPWVSAHLVGAIDCSYAKLVKLLGPPNAQHDDYKSDAEWSLRVNGKVMTIYNYKDGKNYNGKSGIATTRLRDWHIGGEDNLDTEIEILKKALKI
jgi:hypothetical protein